ncbi:MAG: glycosyltransferase family 4 protein, partial [Deltaproteobacteria bacterium]|nr:glycosyltransferase family 4 protein [Deltaproteobacteria bacterium]
EYPPLGGGGAKVVDGLTEELVKNDCQIDLVTMWYRGLPFSEKKGNLNIIRVPCLRFNMGVCHIWEMPLYLIFAMPILAYRCMRYRYDLIHTHFIFPDGMLSTIVGKLFRIPAIITAHGSDVPGYNPDRFKIAHRILTPLWRLVVRSAEKIVCPSRSIEQLVLAQAPQTSTVIIPNGIDLHKFCPSREKKDRILVVTRMFERKGVQYLLTALDEFEHEHEYEIHIVGDGPYLSVLEGHVDEKNIDIKFWGYLDNQSREIRDLYETSSIFVFTSEAENFPIVLLEAMAAGLAIITTESTGCAEVVGDAALLVKPRDSQGIRHSLERLMADPALINKLGRAASERLVKQFGWATVAERYVAVYQEIDNSNH